MLKTLRIGKPFFMVLMLGAMTTRIFAQSPPPLYASSSYHASGAGSQTYALLDLLKELEKEFDVVFDYDKKSLKGKTIAFSKDHLKDGTVGEALNSVLPPLGLQFKKYNDHSYIIFSPKETKRSKTYEGSASGELPAVETSAITIEATREELPMAVVETVVSGTVTDETNSPMPGVNVVVKGTTIGTTTDADGKYAITIPEGEATLTFSFIGYMTEEIPVSNRTVIDVNLIPDVSTLSEVVVIGYGTVKKRDLTGAVHSVKANEIIVTPTHNAVESMQGKVSGVDIVRSSGAPGAAINITVRGNKSITTRDKMVERNSPLYVIDGVQIPPGGNIGDLNTNDIESIEVLKDASATAIYGALGANGVIIVTTKKGASGKTTVSYNGYYGINTYDYPESRTGEDYIQLRREAWIADDPTSWTSPADDAKLFPNAGEWAAVQAGQWIDWIDLLNRDGIQQSHSISLRSGTEKTKIFASGGYFTEEGILKNYNYSRYNARLNVDQTISKWAKAGLSSQVTYTNANDRVNTLGNASIMSPLGLAYDANGVPNLFPLSTSTAISPLADERTRNTARDNTIRTNIITNAYLDLTLLKGLVFRSSLGSNLTFSRRGEFYDKQSFRRASTNTSFASTETFFTRFYNWDNVLTYTKELGEHSITLTGITSYLRSDSDNTDAEGTRQVLSSQLYYDLSSTAADGRIIKSPYIGWKNMAYAGRVNYSYKGKYLLALSGRYDGASRLSPGNKWAFFPSVAVGWNIIDEGFLADVEQITNLKLRASYGVSGNYGIDVYGTQSGLVGGSNMGFGDVSAPMVQFKTTIGNPDLGWEKSATTNIGLDFALFENRINATVDAYQTVTSDILLRRSLPVSSGVEYIYQNIAETENKGIEISVSTQNIKRGDFTWNTIFTFSRNKEEITKLIDGKNIIGSNSEKESLLIGHPINSWYTYTKQGIWQSDEADLASTYRFGSATGNVFQPGDIKMADLNGDNIIDATNDRSYIGSTVPQWIGGIQNNLAYKGFDLGVFVFARYGQTIEAEFLGKYNPTGEGNGPASIDYWTPQNPTNDFPRPRKGVPLNTYAGYQTLSFVDGTFFKIRNITLGYSLPKSVIERVMLSNARVYVTASNIFVKAKSDLLDGFDPERGNLDGSPLSKQFVVGVNLDF